MKDTSYTLVFALGNIISDNFVADQFCLYFRVFPAIMELLKLSLKQFVAVYT